MNKKNSGGGSATHKGIGYQDRVAAWIAVHILAEQGVSTPWDLPENSTLEYMACETDQPVDDIAVGTSDDRSIFIQAKSVLSLGKKTHSSLASALDQFARQFIQLKEIFKGTNSTEIPFEAKKNSLVLVTSPESTRNIVGDLPEILKRFPLTPGQTIDVAAKNKEERKVLDTVTSHLKRSWCNTLGKEPDNKDLHGIFCIMKVHILDVGTDERGEREAKNILRNYVLKDPNRAEVAWDILIQACQEYGASRCGADRKKLQELLLHNGIPLKIIRSFEKDIKQLHDFTRSNLGFLSESSQIKTGSETVKIKREFQDALKKAVDEGSLLITGDPGSGKSCAIHETVQDLIQTGHDVILLTADHLEAKSLCALWKEMGLEHDLAEILNNWPGILNGYLVIDALDAARSIESAQTFREFIFSVMQSPGRWRVVASIRKFDLSYDSRIRELFCGIPPSTFVEKEFEKIHHFNIPLLSDEELGQVIGQLKWLGEWIDTTDLELRNLLKIPFNLRLVVDLAGAGIPLKDISPIRSQMELMDRYWNERVIRWDRQGDARESLLREIAQKMIEKRQLYCNRNELLVDASKSPILHEILSSKILEERKAFPGSSRDRYTLSFSHNMLFDFAVERLLLRGDPAYTGGYLEKDRELFLVIRSSIINHFHYLWGIESDHSQFWDLIFQLQVSKDIPIIGKLIGPAVAADMVETIHDCEQLLEKLQAGDSSLKGAAEQALRFLTQAILAKRGPSARMIAGDGAPPWCELIEKCSRSMSTTIAYSIRPLLNEICKSPKHLTPPQLTLAGRTARRLLEFAWSQPQRDSWLVIHALQAVCHTFSNDPASSASLLRRCLESRHLDDYGFEEIFWLSAEVKMLIPYDPELVKDIYKASFTREEPSREETYKGSSIFTLISNRKQDWDGARYGLAMAYPEFLKEAPIQAIQALIVVMEAYAKNRHEVSFGDAAGEQFDFVGKKAIIKADYSSVWDEWNTYKIDPPMKMLDTFDSHIQGLGKDKTRAEEFLNILGIISSENKSAVLWRRLIKHGMAYPHIAGYEIRSLAWAVPILTNIDTTILIGDFIRCIYKTLNEGDRERIERAILSIPSFLHDKNEEKGKRIRDCLTGCLSPESIVTEQMTGLFHELASKGGPPPNKPLAHFQGPRWSPYDEKAYLADKGVPVDYEPNKIILSLEKPVKEFSEKYTNSSPHADDIKAIFPAIHSLYDELLKAEKKGVHPKLRNHAWGVLTECIVCIVKSEQLSFTSKEGIFSKKVLLQAAENPVPEYDPESEDRFNESPSWGMPSPRVSAAQGLSYIARDPSRADSIVLDSIENLSRDEHPAVRYQISTHLLTLSKNAPDRMWKIIDHFCQNESSHGVLQGLLAFSLSRLALFHIDRIADLTNKIFTRIAGGKGAREVRNLCVSLFRDLYILKDNQTSREIILQIATDPEKFNHEAFQILTSMNEKLNHGTLRPPEEVRKRAFDTTGKILKSTKEAIKRLETSHSGIPFGSLSKEDQENAKQLIRLAESVGKEIYFASGAFDRITNKRKRQQSETGRKDMEHFLDEAYPLMEDLAQIGHPVIVHKLIETLEFFIDLNPERIFLLIHQVLQAAKTYAYQYEPLAVDLIVRLVEAFMFDYRDRLKNNGECRKALIEILDIFVGAGWPSAIRLTYQLQDIYR